MKQMIKIIRKVDIQKQYLHILHLEQEYELASLHQAMEQSDEKEIERSKQRLKEIRDEICGISL